MTIMAKTTWVAGLLLAVLVTLPAAAQTVVKKDRHVGYYYPTPQTVEIYRARAVTLADSNRVRRMGFVTELTKEILSKPYPPQFVIFAKGTEAQDMIIVGLYDNSYNTLYRARALLAELSAVARLSPIFKEYGVEDIFTFFDLLKLLGFTKLTISDGAKFAHQVLIR